MANKKNYNKISTENAAANEAIENVDNEVAPKEETPNSVDQSFDMGIVCDCKKLNMRKSPSLKSKPIAVIDEGTEVTVMRKDVGPDFYQVITLDGTKGFCMKKYIKK